jgi:outer membrane protein OmpA-like peptidoglycan-associated protein
MRRRQPEFNYWPGVADTMLIAFIMLLGLWFGQQALLKINIQTGSGGIVPTGEEWRKLQDEHEKLRGHNAKLMEQLLAKDAQLLAKNEQLKNANARISELEKEVAELEGKVASAEKERDVAEAARKDKPPMIELRHNAGFRFPPSKAVLTEVFETLLNDETFPQITAAIKRYNPNTIEVIGHTDGYPVRRSVSNLDNLLGDVLSGRQPVEALQFGSNADLGLIRAAVVRRRIEAWLTKEGHADTIKVRCYSAANSVPLTDKLDDPSVFAGEDDARRRIEIRFTQLVPAPVRPPEPK